MPKEEYDFSGYATRSNIRCADGRTILPNAFENCDGVTVPLVWQHVHDDPNNVLGHALLENRDDGVYCYCSFNDTPSGQVAKETVKHGDVTSLSIYANRLKQRGHDVFHGVIREVSLVLAGANPGARIDNLAFAHDGFEDIADDEAIIQFVGFNDEKESIAHEDKSIMDVFDDAMESLNDEQREAVYTVIGTLVENDSNESDDETDRENVEDVLKDEQEAEHVDGSKALIHGEEEIGQIFDSMSEAEQSIAEAIIHAAIDDEQVDRVTAESFGKFNESQKEAVYTAVRILMDEKESVEHSDTEGEDMKFNVFDEETGTETVLSHDDMKGIFDDAKSMGSLKDAVLAHGIQNIEVLFPEVQAVNKTPMSIVRRMEWVSTVISGTHKTPFSRLKSTAANLTEDEARARGYIKGNQKVEEQITALKRITTPTTIYKLQKLDRDDIIDITDFDVVAWMKDEMRMMLDEEIARAILIGDGRPASSNDKINELNIRPVWTDEAVYVIDQPMVVNGMTAEQKAKEFVDQVVRSKKEYKGSGTPTMFIGPDLLVELRLLKDADGYRRYKSDAELASDLRVSKIVEVELFDDATRMVDGVERQLGAIILNMSDYTVGATKGGEVTLFDDFDLNFNKYEYLIETRMCGALTMPYSAIVIEFVGEEVSTPKYRLANVHDDSNPASENWYIYEPKNGYVKTTDTKPDHNKIYYTTASKNRGTSATGATGVTGSTGSTGSTGA